MMSDENQQTEIDSRKASIPVSIILQTNDKASMSLRESQNKTIQADSKKLNHKNSTHRRAKVASIAANQINPWSSVSNLIMPPLLNNTSQANYASELDLGHYT